MDHQEDSGKERKLPEYQMDYCFPGDGLGFKWTGLVSKERMSKAWMATAVPTKGACGKFGVDKCLEFIEENGDGEGDILVKTDQEPAIQYLIKELVEARADGKRWLKNLRLKAVEATEWQNVECRNSKGRLERCLSVCKNGWVGS